MGWLVALGVIALLAVIPMGVDVRYDARGPLVRVIAGPVRFTVFPLPKKGKKKQKPEPEKTAPVPAEPEPQNPPAPPKPKEEKKDAGHGE